VASPVGVTHAELSAERVVLDSTSTAALPAKRGGVSFALQPVSTVNPGSRHQSNLSPCLPANTSSGLTIVNTQKKCERGRPRGCALLISRRSRSGVRRRSGKTVELEQTRAALRAQLERLVRVNPTPSAHTLGALNRNGRPPANSLTPEQPATRGGSHDAAPLRRGKSSSRRFVEAIRSLRANWQFP